MIVCESWNFVVPSGDADHGESGVTMYVFVSGS
jgi:hypothetical protein